MLVGFESFLAWLFFLYRKQTPSGAHVFSKVVEFKRANSYMFSYSWIVRKIITFQIPLYLAQWGFLSFREITYGYCLGSDAVFMKPFQA